MEDEKESRQLYAVAAEKAGYRVTQVETGLAAKNEIVKDEIDLIILDLGLPDMSGLEVLKHAKGVKPELNVIVVTAQDERSAPIDALNAGAFGYLKKPCRLDELTTAISRAMEHRRLLKENKEMAKSLRAANIDLLNMNAALKKTVAARDEFVSLVSHELRNPLAVVYGFSQTIAKYFDRLDPKTLKNYLDIIQQSTHKLNRMIDELLSLSRLRAGKFIVSPEKMNLPECINETYDKLKVGFPTVKFFVTIDEGAREIVTDGQKFSLIFGNLLENALKYSPEDETVEVAARMVGKTVEIHVIDHGPGIAPEEKEKIFEAFYRTADEVNRKHSGTGLGLTVARGMIELLGGKIRLEPATGKGSDFVIALPKEYEANDKQR